MSTASSFPSLLRKTLQKRIDKNPHYSGRAFARDLGVPQSRLSEILNARAGFSMKTALKMIDALELSPKERDLYLSSIQKMKFERKKETRKKTRPYATLDDMQFSVISEWYHYAILEVTNLTFFKSDPEWISKILGIDLDETIQALIRLERLGLLKIQNGRYVETNDWLKTADEVPSDALKKFHAQNLQNAAKAVYEQPVEKREYLSATLSVNRKQIPVAKKVIREFMRKFVEDFGRGKSKDAVYQVGTQLFELTKY